MHDGLLAWDGSWYADIASRGYGALSRDALRFFPGFPVLGRALGVVVGDRAALVVIANVAALGAAMLLYRLVRWERGDTALATRAAWFLSLAPPAFVFVMAYSDALAILFAIATFLAMRRRNWWWAAAAAAIVGVTRPTGVLLAVPVLIEACRGFSTAAMRERVARAVAVVAAPVGTLVYLGWVGATRDDFLLPYSVQTTQPAPRRAREPVLDACGTRSMGVFDHRVGTALHVPVARRDGRAGRGRVRCAGRSRTACSRQLVVASSVTSTNLDSLERYGLFAFPLVLAVADLTERRLRRADRVRAAAGRAVRVRRARVPRPLRALSTSARPRLRTGRAWRGRRARRGRRCGSGCVPASRASPSLVNSDSALFTRSRLAPTRPARSSWVIGSRNSSASPAISSSRFAVRAGTSRNTASASESSVARRRRANMRTITQSTSGCDSIALRTVS